MSKLLVVGKQYPLLMKYKEQHKRKPTLVILILFKRENIPTRGIDSDNDVPIYKKTAKSSTTKCNILI